MDGSAAMDQESVMAQCNGYGSDGWADLSAYHGPYDDGPIGDYTTFAQFMSSHGLSESINNQTQQQQHLQMIQPHPPPPPPPPPPHHHHHPHPPPPHMCHQQLPLLNTAWPSQLANPTPTSSSTGSYSAPPLPMTPAPTTPVATASSVVPPTTPGKGSRTTAVDLVKQPGQLEKLPRKTLSAEQKRAMCQYHDENPGTRQADIGAKFGVERSTVSKVLRHRDQYLKREQDADFAFKRAKGKNPDFDRTLSNYVRRQQHMGFDVKDEEIMEQARLFARASGNQEVLLSTLTGGWLHKFKLKHGIGSNNRLLRRASDTNVPDNVGSTINNNNKTTTPTPVSPSTTTTTTTQPLSPLSGTRSDEDLHRDTLEFELTYRAQGVGSTKRSKSPTGPSEACDGAVSAISPSASFSLSSDVSVAGFPPPPTLLPLTGEANLGDKRSKTFPSVDVSFMQKRESGEERGASSSTPRLGAKSSPCSPPPPLQLSPTTMTTTTTTTTTCVPPLTTTSPIPIAPHPCSSSSSSTSPPPPTQEEARRAANTLLFYMQRRGGQHFDKGEYGVVVQLAKKLQLQPRPRPQLQTQQQTHHHHYHHGGQRAPIGNLSRILEGDDYV
ncbi:hypothetical protein L249_6464 [Ophiocordyceps polyrhachis-furcata BCC 54312]|uniref:HTH CENPB-type domain-containing protein n=1 Tax=Ophiocordyceps polyrhachis-furcata BCC 54312 TaxID=1330021 RepID=A0A367LLD2_9HYPO|nr:hypothetical protein L249_6464 [Ophiocordyceps polyrhachis-furcata BCC 54312]